MTRLVTTILLTLILLGVAVWFAWQGASPILWASLCIALVATCINLYISTKRLKAGKK